MTKFVALLLACTLAAAPALADTVTHKGQTFDYSVTTKGNVTVISGKDADSGAPFELRVAHGWVEGVVDGQPVSFSVRDTIRLPRTASSAVVATR